MFININSKQGFLFILRLSYCQQSEIHQLCSDLLKSLGLPLHTVLFANRISNYLNTPSIQKLKETFKLVMKSKSDTLAILGGSGRKVFK